MPLSPRAGLASLGRALHPGSSNTSSGKPEAPGLPPPNGKTDLLLRFFDSQFFDEWIAITYLYKSTSPGVQDYLCNRLYSLPEAGIERYLSQLCQLVIHKPHSPLEKVLADLCARSLRIAVKVYWLLNAIAQDHPKLKGAAELRDSCEQAALEGYWEPPFRDPKLLPMSPPPGARWLVSPPLSPSLRSPRGRALASPDGRTLSPAYMERLGREAGMAEASGAFCGLSSARFRSPEQRQASPQGVRSIMMSSYTMGQDALICASPPAATNSSGHQLQVGRGLPAFGAQQGALISSSQLHLGAGCLLTGGLPAWHVDSGSHQEGQAGRAAPATALISREAARRHRRESNSNPNSPTSAAARFRKMRMQLSQGAQQPGRMGGTVDIQAAAEAAAAALAELEVMSPPSSPRLRQTTFGATLDFIEALCDASSGLTSFAPEDRQWALRRGLEEINREIERANRMGVACWFPMGSRDERIVRLAAREASLLNSREKAPFVLIVEVLAAAGQEAPQPATAEATDDEGCSSQARRRASGDLYADSAHSFASRRASTHAQAGPGPGGLLHQAAAGAAAAAAGTSRTPMHRRNDTASSRLPSPGRLGAPLAHSAEPQPPHPSLVVAAADGSTSGQPSAVGESSSARSSPGGSSGTAVSINWPPPARPSAEPGADADPAGRPPLTTRRSLTFDDAATSQQDSQPLRQASGALPPSGAQQPGRQPSGGLARVSSGALHVPGRAVSSSSVMATTRRLSEERQQRADSFSRGLQSAAKGLRGDGPLVSIRLEVLRDQPASTSASETTGSRADTAGEAAPLQSPFAQGSQALGPGGGQPAAQAAAPPGTAGEGTGVHQQPASPTARGDGGGAQPRGFASSLLSRWGFFKRGTEEGEAAVAQAPGGDKAAAARLRFQQPYVRVHFKVHGGINLRLDSRSSPKHRRVPSSEALRRMAQQHNSAIANPAIFSPIPEDFLKAPQQAPPLLPLSPALPEQLADVTRQLREGSLRAGRASIVSASARSLGSTASAKKRQVAPEDTGSRSSSNTSAHEHEPEGAPPAVVPPRPTSQELYPVESAAAVVAAEAAAAAAEALRIAEEAVAEAEQQRLQAARNLQEASAAQRHWGSAWAQQAEPSQHPAAASAQDAAQQQGAEQQAPPATAQEPGAMIEGDEGQGHHTDCAAALPEQTTAEKARVAARAIYGERWSHKCSRIQRTSPHGRRPGWAVRPVIVKSGDDCRQELLAVQLIKAFHDVFQEAELPLWLRPFDVLVTSNKTALIELIPDALSIHTIKAKSPPGTTLVDHFMAMHGQGTPECVEAQRSFAESMAAYSLVCYLLQIKDRHNGNLMLDTQGHIIHIDFGFMLSNSPGGVNFEAAPFKLTRELLEVMDSTSEGKASELFDYFKVLCIQGFLACRKHADRIILLVDMMSTSGCPAFKAGPRAIQALRKRFHLNLTEAQCVEVMLSLISDSLDAWRTRQYDYYQRVLNGIL